ncbi:hypothetical protein [Nocardia sp. CA-119907]|uniref:hypothetical protein n=1 Tax=Nocardia sp. CA-119907 TaxID=3239973 RepID=UPI003D96C2D8
MSGYWKPGRGIDFYRVGVVVDEGRIRERCEVFAQFSGDTTYDGDVQLTFHREAGFKAVAHLVMTVDDAVAVLAVLRGAITEALTAKGQQHQPITAVHVLTDRTGAA